IIDSIQSADLLVVGTPIYRGSYTGAFKHVFDLVRQDALAGKPVVLSAHAFIHGGAVAFVTQNLGLGLAETAAHWVIDYGKGERWYGFHTDQFLHILCKMAWAGWLIWAM
ncbi:MAG: NAD(P)H-dependent oxidoreductase, partial [Acidobacteria bacterium]|nr:NAD(P)H-dependent oxidoreductase [Acidobacteriota bacterium]